MFNKFETCVVSYEKQTSENVTLFYGMNDVCTSGTANTLRMI